MIIGDMEIRLRADIARLQSDMTAARGLVSTATASMARAAEIARTALASIAGAMSLSKFVELSDAYTKLTAQLRLATDGTREYAQAYADVKRIANSSQSDLAATGGLYASLSRATKDLGVSQKGVAQITEAVNLAFKISGAGAQETAGALVQLSQAFASGALRGDEFNSVNEAAPRLMKAIADSLGQPVGALRGMAEQGKLTADVVARALPQALEQLRTEAAGIQTISGAFTVLKNNTMEFVGMQAQASGVVTALTSGIGLLANNLQLLAGVALTVVAAKLGVAFTNWAKAQYEAVAASVAARAATLAAAEAAVADAAAKMSQLTATQAMIVTAREEAVAQLASSNANIAAARAAITAAEAAGAQSFALRTVRLATAELAVAEAQRSAMLAELAVLGRQQAAVSAQMTAALGAQTAAQAALNGATGAGAAAAGLASRALGLLGGPIGAVITVLGLAATAWSVWATSAKDANDKVAESTEETGAQLIERLNKEVAKLKERKALLDAKPEAKNGSERDQAGLASLQADLEAIKASAGQYAGQSDAMREMLTRIVTRQIGEAMDEIQQKTKLTSEIAASGDTTMVAIRERLTGVNQQYLDDLNKLQTALEKGVIKQDEYAAAVSKLATDTFNGSEAGKEMARSIDMQSAAIKRRVEVQGALNERERERISYQQRTGQIDESTAIERTAAAELKGLNDQKRGLAEQLALARRKSDSEKEQADLAGQIDVMNQRIATRREKETQDLFELEQKRYREAVNNSADVIEKDMAELENLRQQTQAQKDQNEQIGLTTKQVAALTAQRLEEAAARKDAEAITAEGLDLTGERADRIRAEARALRERGAAIVSGAEKQEIFEKPLQDAAALVDIMSALDDAAQSAAQGMAESFGSVGEAIGGMTTALSGYQRTEAAIAAQRLSSIKDAGGDRTKIEKANMAAAQASAQAQIKSYGDMAGAAKGFFKENTTGYRVMEGVEKTFRAFEMAMAVTNMAQKMGLLTTYTAASVAGKQAETQATLASVAPEVTAAQIKGQANAAAGVAGQAQGDPYTAWPRMAAMAAVMVGLGFAVSGGKSSVSLSQQRQEAQGTGSVLGDSSAKSESIKRAIDLTASNSSTQINYLSAMTASLRAIENNISSFAAQLVRSTDVTNPNAGVLNSNNGAATNAVQVGTFAAIGTYFGPIGTAIGALVGLMAKNIPILGKIATSIFGGKQSVADSGITMSPAQLSEILASGAKLSQYTDIKTSGGWFHGDKYSTTTTELDATANRQITTVIKSLADSIKIAGGLLGESEDDFAKKLNSFVVDIGEVSLKDLKGDDLQKALESVFSKLGDQMAEFAVGGLAQFQKVGEGYLETLVRVASDYAKLDASLTSIGMTFGATGLQSIAARESLIDLMGGIDELQSTTASFAEDFLTEAERLAPVQKYVSDELAKLNLGWVDTRQEFKQVVLGLDLTTDAGRSTYAALMGLSAAFAATHEAAEDNTKSAQDIADERKDLQDQLDELTMSQTELLKKQRDAIAEVNRPLFDMVQAIKGMKDAADTLLGGVDDAFSALQKVVNREKEAAQASVDAHTASVTRLQALASSLHSTLNSMQSAQQQVTARAEGQAQIRAAVATARAGGALPDADSLKDALSAVQKDASDQFSSYTDYLRDLYTTQNDIGALAGITDNQLTVEQQALEKAKAQLESLDGILDRAQQQIDELKGQSTTLLSIDQAIGGLAAAIAAAQKNPIVSATSGINTAYQQYLGRAPDAAGLAYWQGAAASGVGVDAITSSIQNSNEAKSRDAIKQLYQDLLGRTADDAGLAYWQATGASMDAVKAGMMGSSEYKDHQKLLGVPGFANGGDFAGGVRLVGEVGPEIEVTGASRIHSTQSLMDALRNPTDNSAVLADAVDRLTATVERQRVTIEQQGAALDQIQRNTRRSADTMDVVTEGGNAMRTKEQV